MSVRHLLIVLFLATGAAVAARGVFSYFRTALPQPGFTPAAGKPALSPSAQDWIYPLILAALVVIAFLLRIEGIELRGMSHVEVYIPGIHLPPLISEPPPRLDFHTLLSWDWNDEPHPPLYYFFMFVWTRLFGTGLTSIRMPSVLFGTGSVVLVYMLAAMVYNRRIGLIAAALLAFNGHHIYWSQAARMYAMGCFLGLASAIVLLTLLRQRARRPGLEATYVALICIGVFTQLFFWVLLAAQMLLTLLYSRFEQTSVPRVFSLQVLAAILGSPLWAHAVYRSRPIDLGSPTLDFARYYGDFGFLFLPDDFTSFVPRMIAPGISLTVTLLALACLLAGLVNRGYVLRLDPPGEPAGTWKKLMPVAGGFVLIILGLSLLAWHRQSVMAVTALVPVLAVAAVPAMAGLWPRLCAACARRCRVLQPLLHSSVLPFVVLGILPVLLLMLVSLFKTLMIPRGILMFVPYYLVILAAGIDLLARRLVLMIPLAVLLTATHMYSIVFFHQTPGPTDYRALAQQMQKDMQADDLVFVYPRDWVTTPLFYYFQDQQQRLVADHFAAALARHPGARVWIPQFANYKQPSADMLAALQHYRVASQVSAHMCDADLYVPVTATAPAAAGSQQH